MSTTVEKELKYFGTVTVLSFWTFECNLTAFSWKEQEVGVQVGLACRWSSYVVSSQTARTGCRGGKKYYNSP